MRGMIHRTALLAAVLVSAAAVVGTAAADPPHPASAVFTIGDGNAAVGTQVTFWGAQWWKDNTVSGGTAPASFKGLAENVDLSHCTFDSGPGNSVDPPDSLPAGDVLAVVANSVTKSGPTISGTFTSVVEIQPDPGYAGDPGHDGTGTVVATASCGGTF